jgi:hypothetical protein
VTPYSGWLRVSHGLYFATAYAFVAQIETTLIHRAFSCNFTHVDDKRHIANLILLNRNTVMATASDSVVIVSAARTRLADLWAISGIEL